MVDVAVVGGGIGGLTAALALKQIGMRPTVFERTAELRSGKGGLLLWPNAVRVLRDLGIGSDVIASGFTVRSTEFRSPSRALLGRLPIDEMSAEAGAPTVFIHRDSLMQILATALTGTMIALDHACSGFVERESGVDLDFSGGTSVHARIVVGADGLRSTIRSRLEGTPPPRDAHIQAWGGTAVIDREPLPPGVTCVTIGRGRRFCFAPCGDRRAFWFAAVNDHLDRRTLPGHFAEFHPPIPAIIAGTDRDAAFETRVCDRPPAVTWGRGPVTLLGDAIHPTTPDLAQGACQAIESAGVLARALQGNGSPEAGLRAYERRRQRRTARVTHLSWIATTQSMRTDPLFCFARDAVTDVFLRRVARPELSWLMRGGD